MEKGEYSHLSFRLSDEFVEPYKVRPVEWGFPIGGGNTLGELTFLKNYSRVKWDGTKERWFETCRRVIEGFFSIQRDHCAANRTPWYGNKAQRAAEDAYERLFTFKWTPPGRGLWMMGTKFVYDQGSASLQNCSFLSTQHLGVRTATRPFTRLMEMSMLGIGVGFDTRGADKLVIQEPTSEVVFYQIEDSREGWIKSTEQVLASYLVPNTPRVELDYSLIRAAGEPIRGFGGVAAGPAPLRKLHEHLHRLLGERAGERLSSTDIVDIQTMIGKCVVAGNVRRSAEIAFGSPDDQAFLDLKNWEINPERMGADGWGHLSNNSVLAEVGGNYDHLVDPIVRNGEPGLLYLDLAQSHGRLVDPPNYRDRRALGANPCAEQTLEDNECCVTGSTLIQTKEGLFPIGEVREEVAVWNGDDWSAVMPFETGNLPVYRVTISDGSYIDATPGHKWLARKRTERTFKELKTVELQPGMRLPEYELGATDGQPQEDAYVWGWMAGDGYMDRATPYLLVQESEYEILESLGGKTRAEQANVSGSKFVRVAVKGVVPTQVAISLRDHSRGLPPEVLSFDQKAIADFMGGWIDTDGSVIRQERTDHFVLYGDEPKLRDAQLLLRRIGVNHATLRRFSEKGTVTNLGTRRQDLWRLLIPSYEASAIATRLKVPTQYGVRYGTNNAYPGSVIDRAHKQKITSVELISESEPTYCFDEPINHLGVFGNVMTKQCTLVESYPSKHDSLEDYLRTIKVAYLYAKSVTLVPTHWPETNLVMTRNRRIGTSMSGVAQFAEREGWTELRRWCDEAYGAVQRWDVEYSEWLGVRESIKTTSVKPSGTVSLLAGVTPGVHWPVASEDYIRRMRFRVNDDMLNVIVQAGYFAEPDFMDPEHTMVVEFPTTGPDVRNEKEVSVWEKVALAATLQAHWADNQVSATFTFQEHEKDQISAILHAFDGQIKSLSFLPLRDNVYKQMPYENIDADVFASMRKAASPIDWSVIYESGREADGERYCSNDTCTV